MSETLEQKIARVTAEKVEITSYDSAWPEVFTAEKELLTELAPGGLFTRIEHFGSTAVPGLAAKPVVDILIAASDTEYVRTELGPELDMRKEFDYFWRPSFGDDVGPWYSWFIHRKEDGSRLAHWHVAEPDSELWERILFRDYLRLFNDVRDAYCDVKLAAREASHCDRVRYAELKDEFIVKTTAEAKEFFRLSENGR